MLDIQSLKASIGGKAILKSCSLAIKSGEIHAVMGPNGSGKSTLSNVITGHPDYTIDAGGIKYHGEDLLEMALKFVRQRNFHVISISVGLPGATTMFSRLSSTHNVSSDKSTDERPIFSHQQVRFASVWACHVHFTSTSEQRFSEVKRNEPSYYK